MKLVFIAGPFRADTAWKVEQNVRNAESLALLAWQHGCVAVCPHTNSRFFHGEAPDDVWLKGYLELLARCDAVVFLSGWSKSAGAQAEYQRAKELGIEIIMADMFEAWAKTQQKT